MAVDIIQGKNLKDIPVITESPNQYIIDYNVLMQHGLDENKLPEETILINAPKPFFDSIRWLFIAGPPCHHHINDDISINVC